MWLEQRAGVDVHRVTAHREDHRDAGLVERLPQVLGGAHAVVQVVLVHRLDEALGERLHVPAGHAAVGGKALGEDEQVAALLGQLGVVEGKPAADVAQRVLLRGHRHPVGQPRHLPHDVRHGRVAVALLPALDEPGVLGEAAGVQEQRNVAAGLAYLAQVRHRHRLAAAGVVGHRDEHHGHVPLGQHPLERLDVHVALERVSRGGHVSLGHREVERLGAAVLDVRPRRVEVRVVRDRLPRTPDRAEQDLLRRPPLVGGDHVLEGEQLLHRVAEAKPRG